MAAQPATPCDVFANTRGFELQNHPILLGAGSSSLLWFSRLKVLPVEINADIVMECFSFKVRPQQIGGDMRILVPSPRGEPILCAALLTLSPYSP